MYDIMCSEKIKLQYNSEGKLRKLVWIRDLMDTLSDWQIEWTSVTRRPLDYKELKETTSTCRRQHSIRTARSGRAGGERCERACKLGQEWEKNGEEATTEISSSSSCFLFQVRRAHWPTALCLRGALRASLKPTKERTILSPQRGTLRTRMCPSIPSSTMKTTSVSAHIPAIALAQSLF